MDRAWPMRMGVSAMLAALLARRGHRKRSLSASGAAAAFAVGLLTMQASYTFGLLLILFYLSSSKARGMGAYRLTKLQQERKRQLEEAFKTDGQRSAAQVLSNSTGGVCAAILAQCAPLLTADPGRAATVRWAASVAFLAHYAAVCADTWASEVGILSQMPPRLVTTWRAVPPGTNGAVTALGCACSAAAGLFMGSAYWALASANGDAPLAPPQGLRSLLAGSQSAGGGGGGGGGGSGDDGGGGGGVVVALPEPLLVPLLWAGVGLAAGVAGSLVDSLLGATVQFSGFDELSRKAVGRPGSSAKHISGRLWLSNDAVNMAAAAAVSLAAAALAWRAAGTEAAG